MFRPLILVALLVVTSLPQAFAEIRDDRPSAEEIQFHRLQIEREFGEKKTRGVSPESGARLLVKNPQIDPEKRVPRDLLTRALTFLSENKKSFKNRDWLTIVDFGKTSDRSRMFLVNLVDGSVLEYHTTHGQNSDPNDTGLATIFGNEINSGRSSVGFFRTAETYHGAFGYSLRIDGLEETNSNVRARAVVIHAWDKVVEKDVKQERSYGCFALDPAVRDGIINKIKGKSLIYAAVSANP